MLRSSEIVALTTPADAKQASLLYDWIALLEVNAPLGFTTRPEDWREFKQWCVQRAEIVPDEKHQWVDYRAPLILYASGQLLRTVTALCNTYSGQFIVSLLPGHTDVADDLRKIGAEMDARPGGTDSPSGIARLLVSDAGLVDADRTEWSQIREFRRDYVAKEDYRGILRVHRVLESAKSETHARELLEALLQAHNEAATKHGLPIEGASVIQLVTGLSASAFAYASNNVETLIVTGLGTIAAAAYNWLTARQERRQSDAPSLLVKARGFVSSEKKAVSSDNAGES